MFPCKKGRERVPDGKLVDMSAETWAWTAASYAANAVAEAPLHLYATTGAGERAIRSPHGPTITRRGKAVSQVYAHPLLELLDSPNPRQTQYEFLAETQIFIDTVGDAYWYVEPNSLGVPGALWLLPSQKVRPVVRDNRLTGWKYTPGGQLAGIYLTLDEVIHFRSPNTLNQITGMGCLEAAYRSAEILDSMATLELALNDNLAMPALVVSYKGGVVSAEDRRRLEAEWNAGLQGLRKSGRVKVADEQFDVTPLGLSPREMQFLKGRQWSREEIMAAYKVPLSLVTAESVNRATAEAGLYQFARWGVEPRLRLLQQTLNRWLVPMYNEPRIHVEYNSVVPADREFELEKLKFARDAELLTNDELSAQLENI